MTSARENDSVASELAKRIARNTLYSNYDPLLACRDLASLRGRLLGVAEDVMGIFLGVASEIDDLPIGTERENWAAATLMAKDAEAESYRGKVRDTVKEALQQLLSELGGPDMNQIARNPRERVTRPFDLLQQGVVSEQISNQATDARGYSYVRKVSGS